MVYGLGSCFSYHGGLHRPRLRREHRDVARHQGGHQIEDLESDDVLGTCSALDTKLTKMRGAVLPLSRIVLSKRLMKDTFKMRDRVRAWLHTERSTVGLLTVAQDEP